MLELERFTEVFNGLPLDELFKGGITGLMLGLKSFTEVFNGLPIDEALEDCLGGDVTLLAAAE